MYYYKQQTHAAVPPRAYTHFSAITDLCSCQLLRVDNNNTCFVVTGLFRRVNNALGADIKQCWRVDERRNSYHCEIILSDDGRREFIIKIPAISTTRRFLPRAKNPLNVLKLKLRGRNARAFRNRRPFFFFFVFLDPLAHAVFAVSVADNKFSTGVAGRRKRISPLPLRFRSEFHGGMQ